MRRLFRSRERQRLIKALFVAVMVTGLAPAATAAPGVQLAIREGRVWLNADRAPLGRILAEWSRVGGTLIVNGERVPGGPVTLALNDIPEEQALEILLRGAGGYVAVTRAAVAVAPQPGASRFERIVILPSGSQGREGVTAAAPRAPADPQPVMPVPSPLFTPSGAERVIGADGQPVADDQEDAPTPRPPVGSMPPGFSPPPEAPPDQPTTPPVPAGTPRPGMIPPPPRRPGV
jgi:hypothetical protein